MFPSPGSTSPGNAAQWCEPCRGTLYLSERDCAVYSAGTGMLMMTRGNRHLRRLGKKAALEGIFSAFRWLAKNGRLSHTIEWLGEYPLLSSGSPRDAVLTSRFLCSDADEGGPRAKVHDPFTRTSSFHDRELPRSLAWKKYYTAFTYLDSACCHLCSMREALLIQRQAIMQQFAVEHGSESLLVVRSDNLHSNGDGSIRESITNLIVAQFFISNGFLVLEDTGSGPDIIALKTSLLNALRERRFIGRGASLSQLATIRAFGKVNDDCREVISEDEIIAVESESASPRRGMKQLNGGYNSGRFSYMGFFDRRVLAAPFFNQGATSFDILTYDTNGIEYRQCKNAPQARDFWSSKKRAFVDEVTRSIKAMLLLNLTYEETASMVTNRPQAAPLILREIPKLQTEKILDKIESVL